MPTPNTRNTGVNTGSDNDSIQDLEQMVGELQFASIAEETPEQAATREKMGIAGRKGIDVEFRTSAKRGGKVIKGKLVDWSDPKAFRVVGFSGSETLQYTYPADELHKLNPSLESVIEKTKASTKVRNSLTSILEDSREKYILTATLDDGGKAETLEASTKTFELPGDIEGAAATSIAGYIHKKGSQLNEDRSLVIPKEGLVAAIDGMGGGGNGSEAAQITGEAIVANSNDIPAAAKVAQSKLASNEAIGSSDGACFLSAKVKVGEKIDVHQCGDIDLHHFNKKGKAKYHPSQYLEMGKDPQSAIDFFENDEDGAKALMGQIKYLGKREKNPDKIVALEAIKERIQSNTKPFIEAKNPWLPNFRKIVANAITKEKADPINFQSPETVEPGDWVVIVSDGVSDNLLSGELEGLVQDAIRGNWSPDQLIKRISEKVAKRMKLKANDDPLAKKNHYKLDNATIIAMRVKGEPATQAVDVAA